jgi:lysozyme
VYVVLKDLLSSMDLEILFDQLKDFEGLELKPYRCTSNKLTIGLGRNLEDNGITEEEAYYLATNDLDSLMDELDRKIPWWDDLNEPRKRALLNLAYNVGTPTLMKFKKTLEHLKNGLYTEASEEVLQSRWADQVGRRATFISEVFKTGVDD